MSSPIQERYRPVALTANAVYTLGTKNAVNGFICVTSGTITVTNQQGIVVLNAFPVSAGTVYGLAMFVGPLGGTVTLAGGASGTLLVP